MEHLLLKDDSSTAVLTVPYVCTEDYDNGDFLVSGRQVPRTGGIIIARGKDRDKVERLMNNDPFVKKKFASMDIVEFTASQTGKGLRDFFGRM